MVNAFSGEITLPPLTKHIASDFSPVICLGIEVGGGQGGEQSLFKQRNKLAVTRVQV